MQLLLLAHGLSRLGRTSESLAGTAPILKDIGLAVQHLKYIITGVHEYIPSSRLMLRLDSLSHKLLALW